MSLPVTLDEVFAFEQNLETGFVAAMVQQGITPTPQQSRVLTVFSSPYIALYFQNGAANADNQFNLLGVTAGRFKPFNTFDGVLSVVVQTNRGDTSQNHNLLLAQVRRSLQLFILAYNWDLQQIDLPTECRESGSTYECDDELLIDRTTLNFYVLHSINKAAWPTTPIFVILPKLDATIAKVGNTVTVDNGTLINATAPTTYSYSWLRDGVVIAPQIDAHTYTYVTADIGHVISCAVTITAANGMSTATSLASATVVA